MTLRKPCHHFTLWHSEIPTCPPGCVCRIHFQLHPEAVNEPTKDLQAFSLGLRNPRSGATAMSAQKRYSSQHDRPNTNRFQFYNGPQKMLFTQPAACQQVHSEISHPGIHLWTEMIQQQATVRITIMSSANTNIQLDTSNTRLFGHCPP